MNTGGIAVTSTGDDGTTSGGISITTTRSVSATSGFGILAVNDAGSTGATTVSAADVTSGGNDGIAAWNNGTDLTITSSGTVSGGKQGIYARNEGSGVLTITAGDVTGTGISGIDARNFNAGTNLHITSTGTVTGNFSGIFSRNFGTQALTIDTVDVFGTSEYGIDARNNGTDLSITSSGTISGAKDGVRARNFGSGALTINVADVTGTGNDGNYDGIYAANFAGTDLTITSTGTVSGVNNGVFAHNNGSGALTIVVNDVSATGAAGIYGRAGSAGSSITVTGAVSGGRHGIGLNVTGANTITIGTAGSLTGSSYAINTAIHTPAGNDSVINHGTVTGNVTLGGGVNAFNNATGGIFNALDTIDLGVDNSLTNSGTLSPGGTGTVQTTTLTGDLAQTPDGRIAVDVDPGTPVSDRINVSGTASLGGVIEVNMLSTPGAAGTVTILSAAGGVTDIGLSVMNTVVVDYTLTYPNANDVTLGYSVDFTPDDTDGFSLSGNEAAIGGHLDAIHAAGAGEMDALYVELMKIESMPAYLAALNRLHGEHYLVQTGRAIRHLHDFRETLLSCPSLLDGIAIVAADDHCLWGQFSGQKVDIRRSSNSIGGDETSFGFSGGYEMPLGEGMRAGLAVAIETSDLKSDNASASDGMRYTIGAKFEKAWGAFEAGLGAYGGIATHDTTRQVGLGMGTATGDQDIVYGGVVTRLSHTYDTGSFRIVPMIDLAATHVSHGDIQESGAGAANLSISGEDQWVLSATPAIGVMGTLLEKKNFKINGSFKTGVSLYSNDSYSFTSTFAGAPSGVSGFLTSTEVDSAVANIAAAVELQTASGISLKVGYDGGFGNVTRRHGGHLRAILPF